MDTFFVSLEKLNSTELNEKFIPLFEEGEQVHIDKINVTTIFREIIFDLKRQADLLPPGNLEKLEEIVQLRIKAIVIIRRIRGLDAEHFSEFMMAMKKKYEHMLTGSV